MIKNLLTEVLEALTDFYKDEAERTRQETKRIIRQNQILSIIFYSLIAIFIFEIFFLAYLFIRMVANF